MREVSPVVRGLARQVLVREVGGRQQPEALAEAAERAYHRLRQHLSLLIGPIGFKTLFARALSLAKSEFPILERIEFEERSDAGLKGVREFAVAHDPAEASDGLAAILASFISLLGTFIGEDLGLRLVREAWPQSAHDEVESSVRRQEHE